MEKILNKKIVGNVESTKIENYELLLGMRIPRDYFTTTGTGQSDITIHAGSYHLALKAAGIEMANIMTYSSIMPGIAREVAKPLPEQIVHGAVMESIMAVATAEKGHRATAGIIYGWLHDKETGDRFGGLVCEHNGEYSEKQIKELLFASVNELYENGFSERYTLSDINILCESVLAEKNYATALCSICFTSHVLPIRIAE